MKNTGQNLISFLSIFIILFLISHFSLLIFKAEASALSLSLDPSLIEINALAPSTTTNTLSIQNKEDNLVQLQILIKSFKAKLENGELEYLSSQDSFIAQNIRILDGGIPVEGITLGPKQQKDLTLNINIPQDTNISDYYFSIILVSTNSSPIESSSSLNQIGIASNVLLSVGAKEIPDATLEEFSSNIFFEKGPVPFTIRIKNTGTHFIKPKGEIIIKNMFGQSIGKLDLVSANVLSSSIRAIPNTANPDFQHPKALWKENFLLGLYTATLNISLSNEGPTFIKSIRFLAFPFQLLIIIVIILIGAIIVTTKVRTHMSRRP